ncbi:MAG: 50S ribosomal protein L22 [Candidatus Omnitrophica bacterium]|nr:50S ribosomal protein L22 [Candidatus Omnitrophota bacterium]
MVAKAVARYLRISPHKVRPVAELIKLRRADEAQAILRLTNKRAASVLLEVLTAAVANAQHSHPNVRQQELIVSSILDDGGPTLKRFRAAAMGRATRIRKRTTHIIITLDAQPLPSAPPKAPAAAAPKKAKRVLAAAS